MHDTSKCLSRFVDIIMARLNKRQDVEELAFNALVPVINALDDWGHPCQILADLQTIQENFGDDLKGRKMAYVGDLNNNVTYDLARAAALTGMEMTLTGPSDPEFALPPEVQSECDALGEIGGGSVRSCATIEEAVTGVDVIYADTFQSYHIPKDQQEARLEALMPYQVNSKMMSLSNPNAIFMHCLPASRDVEVSTDVIDG